LDEAFNVLKDVFMDIGACAHVHDGPFLLQDRFNQFSDFLGSLLKFEAGLSFRRLFVGRHG
jgi:hypothetical protein